VWLAGQLVATDLNVVTGSVTLDRTASAMGQATLQFAEPTRLPTALSGGVLSPFGYEIAVRSGIVYADGTSELLPMGVYPIQRSQFNGVTLNAALTTTDRTQAVRDARFTDDYFVAGGTNYATAINTLLHDRVSWLPSLAAPTITFTAPAAGLVFQCGTDPWDALTDMAKSCGCLLYFDGLGVPTLKAEPSFASSPVWTIAEGDDGVLVDATLTLDRAQAYNAVVATAENSSAGTLYRAIATDDDPASPTYYLGPFGKKPRFYASPLLTSTAQCQSAANALLNSASGVARSLDFVAAPNRALEPLDAVLVKRASLGLDEVHLIDALTIDLSVGSMRGRSRVAA
jgi:hypothetical protein